MLKGVFFTTVGVVLILCSILVLFFQFKNRKEAFKNFRFRLHLSLIVFTISYAMKIYDMSMIVEDFKVNGDTLNFEHYCGTAGSIHIFLESIMYVNLVVYIWILRFKSRHPTVNQSKLRLMTYSRIFLFSTGIWAFFYYGAGVGVDTSLTCGIKFDVKMS